MAKPIMNRVVVTGLGTVSPVGVGVKNAWKSIISSQSGLRSLDSEEYKPLGSRVAGIVPVGSKNDGKWDVSEWLDAPTAKRMPLFAQYAVAAAQEALQDAQWDPRTEEESCRTGVAVGSGMGGLDALYTNSVGFHSRGARGVTPLFVPSALSNMAAGHIAIRQGLKGPNHAAATACTTGAHGIGDAANLIRLGHADVMVAGASEAAVHPLSVAGFGRARSLSTRFNDTPERASRPFDSDRDGFVIAEGAAVVVLESEAHARKRGITPYAELAGYGLSGDAHHITAPREDGDGAYRAMESAIKDAQRNNNTLNHIDDIGYINAHATSTVIGDQAESNAITRLFSAAGAKRPQDINVSSTKGATGHLLGAAGALEALFTILALRSQTLPPTLNLENVIRESLPLNYIPLEAQNPSAPFSAALTNSFGFGGTNASLLFTKY